MQTPDEVITIVSGLPRSGTSMMMKILEAGGMRPLTDNIRQADVDNPKGYYELERVKKISHDSAWLPAARGTVFKMVSTLLVKLPPAYTYRIIFMRRPMDEILASQSKMLERLGKPSGPDDGQMTALFNRHLAEIQVWLAKQPNMRVHYVHYGDVIQSPQKVMADLCAFLERPLDAARMAAIVDPELYRNRA
ncbi:MAG: sulfotransferase [Lentisphaerae bacterium]|nr:sulfotransferase [Lentisphaerota bacterium]